MIDDALSLQAPSYGFHGFTPLELIGQTESDQVIQLYFNGHGATGGVATGTEVLLETQPGFRALAVGADDQT